MADLDFLNELEDDKQTAPAGVSLAPAGPRPAAAVPDAPVALPEPVANTDLDFLKEIPDARLPTEDNYWRTAQEKPDEAAKVIGLSQRLQAPAKYVQDHMPDLSATAEAPPPTYWADLAKQNPKTNEFLSEPANMAIAKDDIERMKKQEHLIKGFSFADSLWEAAAAPTRMFKAVNKGIAKVAAAPVLGEAGGALVTGVDRMNAAATRVPAAVYDIAAIPQNLFFKSIGRPDLEVTAPEWLQFKSSGSWWDDQAKQWAPPALDQSIVEQVQQGNYKGAGKVLAMQVIANAPSQALLLAGTAAGYGVPALVAMGTQQAADVAHKNREAGADPAAGALDALSQGVFEAAFESLGTAGLFKTWENALAKSVGKDSAGQVMKAMAKTMAHTFLGEGNEEFWTSLAQDYSSYGYGVDPNAMHGALGRAVDAFAVGSVSGLGMTAPSAIGAGSFRGLEIRRAEQARNAYLAMGASADASKLRERLPAAERQWVDSVTKGTPVEHVYMDPEKFKTYFQEKNLDPDSVAETLGITEQLKDASQNGADLKIPMTAWVENVVGTEHWKGLSEDIKFRPEDLSVRQSKEVEERVNKQFEEEAQARQKDLEVAAKDPAWQAAREAAYNAIYGGLVQAGRKETEARANAELWASHTIADARQRGVAPDQLYFKGERLAINIVANQTPEQVAQQAGAGDTVRQGDPEFKWTEVGVKPKKRRRVKKAQLQTPEVSAEISKEASDAALKYWFADSKVADENGVPKVVYHGTKAAIESFDQSRLEDEDGFFFTADPEHAAGYAEAGTEAGDNIIPVFLKIQNPYEVTSQEWYDNKKADGTPIPSRDELQSQGYDGFFIRGLEQQGGKSDTWVTFDSRQIKSVFNRGTFSPVDPRILRQEPAPGFVMPAELPVIMEPAKTGPPHAVFSFNWKLSANSPKLAYFKLFGDPALITEKTKTPEQPSGNGWASDVTLDTLMKTGIPVVGRMNSAAAAEAPEMTTRTFHQGPAEDRVVPPFYSQLERTIEQKMSNKAQPNEIKGLIAQGVKAEEIAWSGLHEWLDTQKGAVTKQAVMDFLRANALKIEELRHAGRSQSDSDDDDISPEVEQRAEALREAAAEAAMEDWYWDAPPGFGTEEIPVEQPADVGQKDLFGKVIEEKPSKWVIRVNDDLVLWNDISQYHNKHAKEETIVDPKHPDGDELEGIAVFNNQDDADQAYYEQIEEYENDARDEAYRDFMQEHPSEDYIQEAREELGEVPDDDDQADDADGRNKWASYQEEGGEDYGEMLFTLPKRSKTYVESSQPLDGGGWRVLLGDGTTRDYPTVESQEVAQGLAIVPADYAKPIGSFSAPAHWEEDQVFAHVRYNTRTLPDGKLTLFLEEVQSDWHQQGRERGYKRQLTMVEQGRIEQLREVLEQLEQEAEKYSNMRDAIPTEEGRIEERMALRRKTEDINQQRTEVLDQIEALEGRRSVADAPFKKNWHEYVIKRMLRFAADKGFEQVAWTSAKIQVERWEANFREHVDKLEWHKEGEHAVEIIAYKGGEKTFARVVPIEGTGQIEGYDAKLEDLIGDNLAEQVRTAVKGGMSKGDWGGGNGLTIINPSGMEGFYDKIMVEFANRYLKKWGGKVERSSLDQPKGSWKVVHEDGTHLNTFNDPSRERAQQRLDEYTKADPENYSKTKLVEVFPVRVQKPVHVVAITPEMKKQVQNVGQTLFQSKPAAPVYFSQLQAVIQRKLPDSFTIQQLRDIMAGPDVKREEVEWSGLDAWYGDRPATDKVKKSDVLAALGSYAIEVTPNWKYELTNQQIGKELVPAIRAKGWNPQFGGDGANPLEPRLVALIDPDGKVYRTEFSGQLQAVPDPEIRALAAQIIGASTLTPVYGDKVLPGGSNYRELLLRIPMSPAFKSSHWSERNVLVHARFNDRTAADGKRVLFIEEIQSDWHQQGRQKGYKKLSNAQLETKIDAWLALQDRGVTADQVGFQQLKEWGAPEELQNDYLNWRDTWNAVPDAPFKDTKAWTGLAVKQLLRYAAEQGYERVAWTTGDQQAARYNQTKELTEVRWRRSGEDVLIETKAKSGSANRAGYGSFTKEQLAGQVGKDLAGRILSALDAGEAFGTFADLDLKIGGEGMREFYDRIVPSVVEKAGKPWKLTVQDATFNTDEIDHERLAEENRKQQAEGTFTNLTPEDFKKLLVVHSVEIPREMRESLPSFPLFQENKEGGDDRGFTTFGQDHEIWVSILESADESTFAHEAAHIMLQRRFEHVLSGQANAKVLADWQVLADWMGVTADQTQLTVEQHEKFARGFELYLREGRAPAEGLRRVFALFRRWLTRIYKDPSALKVNVTDPVRGVMDRLIASEEEIAFAESTVGQNLGKDLEHLAPEVRARLQDMAEQAHDEAVSQLLARQMKEISAEHKEMLAQEKSKANRQAQLDVAEIPEQKALEGIRRATFQSKDGRKVAEQYLNPEGGMSEEDITSWDMLAELYGYQNGQDMAQKLIEAPSFNAEVTVRVNQHMSQFADLRNTDRIREEAMNALHNDLQTQLLAAELAAFETLVDDAQGRAVLKERRRVEARVEQELTKQKAAEMIRKKNTSDAIQFMPYFTAERNAAIKASKAMADKDYENAAKFKRQQLLNHALAVESLKARRQVERWERYLTDTQRKDMELFKKEEHFAQVAGLLQRFGFPRKDYDPRIRKETLQQWATRMEDETGMVSLPDWLLQDETYARPYKDMPLGLLNELVDALRNIQRVANAENTTVSIEKGKDINMLVGELASIAERNTPNRKKYNPSVEPARFDKAKSLAAKYTFNLKKISTILFALDGNREFGRWSNIFWNPVYDAANVESEKMRQLNRGLVDLWSVYTKAERRAMVKPAQNADLETSISKMRLLVLALNIGNDGNREKAFGTRPVGVPATVEWNETAVMDLLQKNFDQRDWEFVQRTWNFINTLWPDASAMHKELTGFSPKKVEARAFDVRLPDGTLYHMAGGYFPLKRDPRSSGKAQLQETLDSPLYTEQFPGWKAMTKTGHLKSRVETKYPVALEISLINRHLRDVVHDIAFRPTIIDLRRILNNEGMQETLRRNLGPEGFANVREWVASVAGSTIQDHQATQEWETMVAAMRKRTVVAVLFLKPAIFLQNFSNVFLFPNAIEGFGYGHAFRAYFARGLFDFMPKMFNPLQWKDAQDLRDFVYGKSSMMADRKENPDFSLTETQNKLFGENKPLREFAGWLMGTTDEATNVPMWLEAYNVALNRGESEYQAIRFADKLIDNAVGTGRKYDQAGITRGSELVRAMAMFYSFWSTEYNRWSKESGRVVAPQHLPRFLGFVASRMILFNMASMVLSGGWPKEEENNLAWWIRQLLGYPLAFFPGIRDVVGVALDETLGLKSYGYRPSPATGAIESGLRAVQAGAAYAKGERDLAPVLEQISHAAAFAYPYPDQLNNIFWNAYDILAEGMEPQWRDIYRRRPKNER